MAKAQRQTKVQSFNIAESDEKDDGLAQEQQGMGAAAAGNPVSAPLAALAARPANQLQQQDTLSAKLKALYAAQDTLPKLIDDDKLEQQSLSKYYIKLQVVLNESSDGKERAAAHDKVLGEKAAIEIENIFGEVDDSHPEVARILLLGKAGLGKTTLLHYMSYKWGKDDLWTDKFDSVFRIRLKELLDTDWSKKYTIEELQESILGCFVHYCLSSQYNLLKDHDLPKITLAEVFTALASKDQALLLLDGYDEIAPLNNKYHPSHHDYSDIMTAIFEHKYLVMSSRPNALKADIKSKFERDIESKGLDYSGISQYIDLNFNKDKGAESSLLGAELKAFLSQNPQIMELCEAPINTALICLIWGDREVREKFTSGLEFNIGALYKEVIVWLGKRYLEKFEGADLENFIEEDVLYSGVVQFLRQVAYDSFIDTGKLVKAEVIDKHLKEFKQIGRELKIENVNKFGLIKPDGDGTKLVGQNYQFAHLTFQEYLTAYHLKEQLGARIGVKGEEQEKLVREAAKLAAKFIGEHRNEPKYLMTLKFLSGLVTSEEGIAGQELVLKFWEAAVCNVDGVLELGIDSKVTLLMHLLGQASKNGIIDPRIPNLSAIQQLIDEVVLRNINKWGEQIIASGYLSPGIIAKLRLVIQGSTEEHGDEDEIEEDGDQDGEEHEEQDDVGEDADKDDVEQDGDEAGAEDGGQDGIEEDEDRDEIQFSEVNDQQQPRHKQALDIGGDEKEDVADQDIPDEQEGEATIEASDNNQQLRTALEIVTSLMSKKVFGTKEEVFKQLLGFIAIEDWRLQKFVLEKLTEVSKEGISYETLETAVQQIVPLITDENLRDTAINIAVEISKSAPELAEKALALLQPLFESWNYNDREIAIELLPEIIKLMPPQEDFELLQPLFESRNDDVKMTAAEVLPQLVEASPELAKGSLALLQPLFESRNDDVKKAAAETLKKIVGVMPPQDALVVIQTLFESRNDDVKMTAAEVLPQLVEASPAELAKESLALLQPLFKRGNDDVKKAAAETLKKIVEVMPPQDALVVIQPLFESRNDDVLKAAIEVLLQLVEANHEVAQKALVLLQPLFKRGNDDDRKIAIELLPEIIKLMPPQDACELIQPLFASENCNVQETAKDVLKKIVEAMPPQEALKVIQPLFASENYYVRRAAAEALPEILKIMPPQDAWDSIQPLFTSENYYAQNAAAKTLPELVKTSPELARPACELIQPLFASEESFMQETVVEALLEIVKLMPPQDAWDSIQPLFTSKNYYAQKAAAKTLPELVKTSPELARPAWELIQPLFKSNDYYVKKAAIEVLPQLVEANHELAREALALLQPLFESWNYDVKKAAQDALGKIVEASPELVREALVLLQPLFASENDYVKKAAAEALSKLVEANHELAREALVLLQPLFASKYDGVQKAAIEVLLQLVEASPELAKGSLALLQPLFESNDYYAQEAAAKTLPKLVEASPELARPACELIQPLLASENSGVQSDMADMLRKLVEASPESARSALGVIQPLLASENSNVQEARAKLLPRLVEASPELAREVLEIIQPLLASKYGGVQWNAAKLLPKLVEASPELARPAWELIQPLLASKDDYLQKVAVEAMPKLVEASPELARPAWELIQPLLASWNTDVQKAAVETLPKLVEASPELAREAFVLIQPLLASENWQVQSAAQNALGKIVEALSSQETLGVIQPLLASWNDNVKKAAQDTLGQIVEAMSPQEAWELIQPLLASENWQVQSAAQNALGKIVEAMPPQEALVLLQPLLVSKNYWVKNVAIDTLGKLIEASPELAQASLELIQPLFANEDSNVNATAGNALCKIIKAIPTQEAWEFIQPLLASKDSYVQLVAAEALPELVEASPELARPALVLLQPLLASEYRDVKETAGNALCKIIKAIPTQEAWEFIQPLLASDNDSVWEAAVWALPTLVEANHELASRALVLLQPLLTSKNDDVQKAAVSVLPELVEANPKLTKEVWEFIKPHLERLASSALPKIFEAIAFGQVADLLNNDLPIVRDEATKALLVLLKEPEAAAKIDHTQISILFAIVGTTKGLEDTDSIELFKLASKVLLQLAAGIDEAAIAWLNSKWGQQHHDSDDNLKAAHVPVLDDQRDDHFKGIANSSEARLFFKAVFHKTLSDEEISDIESKFILNCITKLGFTVTITKDGRIIFEDVGYQIKGEAAKAKLEEMVNAVLAESDDMLAQQYKDHVPLFVNSGSAMPIAAIDIKDGGSIVNGVELNNKSWQVSLMHLSDHNHLEPSNIFILLEKSNVFGGHYLHKIFIAPDGRLQIAEHKVASGEISSELRQEIFGNMDYIDAKPRYYGIVFEVDLLSGEKILQLAQDQLANPHLPAEYDLIRGLLQHVDLSLRDYDPQKSWKDYLTQEGMISYKKDALLKVDSVLVRKDSDAIKDRGHIAELAEKQKSYDEQIAKIQQELATKLDNFEKKLQVELAKIKGLSAKDKEAIQDYYKAFIGTFASVYVTSQVIDSGQIQLDTGNIKANILSTVASFVPFIGNSLSGAIGSINDFIQKKEMVTNARIMKNLAFGNVAMDQFAGEVVFDIVCNNGKQREIANITDEKLLAVTKGLLEKISAFFDKIGEKIDVTLYGEMYRTPAAKLGHNDANDLIGKWISGEIKAGEMEAVKQQFIMQIIKDYALAGYLQEPQEQEHKDEGFQGSDSPLPGVPASEQAAAGMPLAPDKPVVKVLVSQSSAAAASLTPQDVIIAQMQQQIRDMQEAQQKQQQQGCCTVLNITDAEYANPVLDPKHYDLLRQLFKTFGGSSVDKLIEIGRDFIKTESDKSYLNTVLSSKHGFDNATAMLGLDPIYVDEMS